MNWSNDEKNIVDFLNENVDMFKKEPLEYEGKRYSTYDAYNKTYTCEIKKRNFESYHKYAQEGLILEKKKYDALIEKANTRVTDALYINIFTDNKAFIWNLTKLTKENYDFSWHPMKMNKATFRSKYDKIEKEIALLKENIIYA